MEGLNLPFLKYQLQKRNNKYYILDIIRKKYIQLTPEEWVRQHFLHYLINYLAYPKSLIRLEKILQHGNNKRRPDIVICNTKGSPWVVVECKPPHKPIHEKVVGQITHYNSYLKARYLIVTNGIKHFCWQLQQKPTYYIALKEIPHFQLLK